MTTGNEQWWERLPRILGGWDFALAILLKFPFPEGELVDGTVVRLEPGLVAWAIYVTLIVFFVGIAHSTVTGIVLGNVTKAIAAVRRALKGKRHSSASHRVEPGTAASQPDIRPPKKPRSRP